MWLLASLITVIAASLLPRKGNQPGVTLKMNSPVKRRFFAQDFFLVYLVVSDQLKGQDCVVRWRLARVLLLGIRQKRD